MPSEPGRPEHDEGDDENGPGQQGGHPATLDTPKRARTCAQAAPSAPPTKARRRVCFAAADVVSGPDAQSHDAARVADFRCTERQQVRVDRIQQVAATEARATRRVIADRRNAEDAAGREVRRSEAADESPAPPPIKAAPAAAPRDADTGSAAGTSTDVSTDSSAAPAANTNGSFVANEDLQTVPDRPMQGQLPARTPLRNLPTRTPEPRVRDLNRGQGMEGAPREDRRSTRNRYLRRRHKHGEPGVSPPTAYQ